MKTLGSWLADASAAHADPEGPPEASPGRHDLGWPLDFATLHVYIYILHPNLESRLERQNIYIYDGIYKCIDKYVYLHICIGIIRPQGLCKVYVYNIDMYTYT